MGNEYASKHICNLRKLGFEFETVKEGRSVASYRLVKEPENVDEIRNPVAKEKVAKPEKPAKAPKEKAAKKASAKATAKEKNLAKLKEVAKGKKAKVIDVPEEDEEDSNVDVATSHQVDNEFDSLEGVDLKALVG
jgi:hypothetical protein